MERKVFSSSIDTDQTEALPLVPRHQDILGRHLSQDCGLFFSSA
jgi:hypothetical protein